MPENLKELLKKNGITEKELATRAGISEQTIKRICNGKNKFIRVSTVKKICEALGESADFIYLGIRGDDPGEEEATAELMEEGKADLMEEGKADLIAAEHEEKTHSATATRKAFSSLTVGTLKSLEAEIYKAYGVDSKPAGLKWVEMALDLAKRITEAPDLLDTIMEADLDQLTEENAHTARHAAEVALHLKKYTI